MAPHHTIHDSHARNIETVAYVVEHAGADFALQNIVLDGPQGNEYLIEMKYTGICHTDLICQQGSAPSLKFPAILGHEGAGYIRAIGNGVQRTDIKVGDFVLLSFNFCGECKRCRRNQPSTCLDGGKLHIGAVRANGGPPPARSKDGRSVQSSFFGQSSFAAMSVVDATCVAMRYPYDPEDAAIFAACGCGFQTGAGTVLNVLQPQQDDSIVIFGLGSVGLTALMAAKYLRLHQIIAVDINPGRLELAKELGATHLLNSKDVDDMAAALRELSTGGVDFAIDCVGK
ncbi:hypothetical protein LTR86_001811 [Recurvomyces mirabilis]|nr:hypothetical protein LTR86_001811 [Recurvomyces mirabilis]